MRPVTPAFLRTVRSSHRMMARARVCTTYQTGTSPTGEFLTVLDGDVELNAKADVFATLSLTVDGTNAWPLNSSQPLGPYGNEIYVERGVRVGNAPVWVGLGYFRIDEVSQARPPHGPIVISGSDRMAGIIDARPLAPMQIDPSTTKGDAVELLVREVYPDATIEWDDATALEPLGRSIIVEDDRFAAARDIWVASGKVAWWDYRGILAIKDLPSPTDPVFDITSGNGGVLVSMSRTLTRAGVYNAVVASGEAPDEGEPARGVAIDGNPASPTWYFGRFGKVPRYYGSPLLTTNEQAEKAAITILAKASGLPYSVDFTAICNPALEPYDAINVKYSNRFAREVHILDTLTVPLIAKTAMTGTTRQLTGELSS